MHKFQIKLRFEYVMFDEIVAASIIYCAKCVNDLSVLPEIILRLTFHCMPQEIFVRKLMKSPH